MVRFEILGLKIGRYQRMSTYAAELLKTDEEEQAQRKKRTSKRLTRKQEVQKRKRKDRQGKSKTQRTHKKPRLSSDEELDSEESEEEEKHKHKRKAKRNRVDTKATNTANKKPRNESSEESSDESSDKENVAPFNDSDDADEEVEKEGDTVDEVDKKEKDKAKAAEKDAASDVNMSLWCKTEGTGVWVELQEGPYRRSLLFRNLDVRAIQAQKRADGSHRITFLLMCPPLFECHMVISGAGNSKKWVRTNDWSLLNAGKYARIKIITTASGRDTFFEYCEWAESLLQPKLDRKYFLYWHVTHALHVQASENRDEDTKTKGEQITALVSGQEERQGDESFIMDDDEKDDHDSEKLELVDLPIEIIMHIFGYVPPRSLVILERVSSWTRQLANDDSLWKGIYAHFAMTAPWITENVLGSEGQLLIKSWKEAFRVGLTRNLGNYRCVYCGEKKKNGKLGQLLGVIICDECGGEQSDLKLLTRTQAEKTYGLSSQALIDSPVRRITRITMTTRHKAAARWYLAQDLDSWAQAQS